MKSQKKIEIKRNYPARVAWVKRAGMFCKTSWENGKQKIEFFSEQPTI